MSECLGEHMRRVTEEHAEWLERNKDEIRECFERLNRPLWEFAANCPTCASPIFYRRRDPESPEVKRTCECFEKPPDELSFEEARAIWGMIHPAPSDSPGSHEINKQRVLQHMKDCVTALELDKTPIEFGQK